MKVVIMNDCAFVGRTIAEELQRLGWDVDYRPRPRTLYGKTLGVLLSVLRSSGDIYHVNYGLQDAYLISLFKTLHVLHCHGSEVRWGIDGRYGKIIEHNLRTARKVFVSTPDILERALKYNKTSEYLPNPVDTTLFRPIYNRINMPDLVFIYASKPDPRAKGTNAFLRTYHTIKEKYHKKHWRIKFIEGVDYLSMPNIYASGDVIVGGDLTSGALGKVALEGMACKKPVINNIKQDWYDDEVPQIPMGNLLDVDNENIRKEMGEKGLEFVMKHHEKSKIINIIKEIYGEVL